MSSETDTNSQNGSGGSDSHGPIDRARQAKDVFDTFIEKGEDFLSGDEGMAGALKRNPIATVGIAFSTGFLAALTTGGPPKPGFVETRRKQVRALLLSGLLAATIQELRSALREDEVQDFLKSFRASAKERIENRELW